MPKLIRIDQPLPFECDECRANEWSVMIEIHDDNVRFSSFTCLECGTLMSTEIRSKHDLDG